MSVKTTDAYNGTWLFCWDCLQSVISFLTCIFLWEENCLPLCEPHWGTEVGWVKAVKKKKKENFLIGLFQGGSVPCTICNADAQVAVPAHVRQAGVGREGTCTERAIP